MGKALILVEEKLADLVRLLLERSDPPFAATTVLSGADALRELSSQQFDLLILGETLPDYSRGQDFLKEWRSSSKETAALTLMILDHKYGYTGFVRSPLAAGEAHAYLPSLFPPETFRETTSQLLKGASTQNKPGDEGYSTCEARQLGLAFNYPSFWRCVQRGPTEVSVVGPMNRHGGLYAEIMVKVYPESGPDNLPNMEELAKQMLGVNVVQDIRKAAAGHKRQIGGFPSIEGEYLYKTIKELPDGDEKHGRMLMGVADTGDRMCVLGISAAEEVFDDFRPVYEQLVKTFAVRGAEKGNGHLRK